MTDPPKAQGLAKADARLRGTLSSWHQRRRYRLEASAHDRSHPIGPQFTLASIESLGDHAISSGNGF
jgi:hypothetical protein